MKAWSQRIWGILIIVVALKDEKVLKVVLKKCIESKADIKSMADGRSLDMLTDKIMELVRDVYL